MIFIAAGLFFPGQVMRVMGADAVIEAIGIPYIRIVLCFTPFFMMNYAFTAFVRNDNAPHIAMAATLLSSLFNIVFDYVFMFPLGMGMTGAALATAVSPIVSILICMVHYLSPKSSVSFQLYGTVCKNADFLLQSWHSRFCRRDCKCSYNDGL